MLSTIIIFSAIIGSCYSTPFWITAQIESIEWQEGCLTTALCTQPRFQLVEDLLPISERSSISWPVTERIATRQFVSYWPVGRVEDVSISAQVIGVDRTYGFPRVCDQTPAVRVFPDDFEEFATLDASSAPNKTIHIKAKCFDATIVLIKHQERCPWCPDPSDIEISNEVPQDFLSEQFALHSIVGTFSSENLQVTVLLLATFAVVTSTAFAILLVVYIKSKRDFARKNMTINVQPRLIPYEKYTYSSRYDHPWSYTTSTSSTGSSIPPPPSFPPPV